MFRALTIRALLVINTGFKIPNRLISTNLPELFIFAVDINPVLSKVSILIHLQTTITDSLHERQSGTRSLCS